MQRHKTNRVIIFLKIFVCVCVCVRKQLKNG